MKVLITGAKGFIGSHLATCLKKEGHDTLVIDDFSHPSKHPIKVDYCDVRIFNDITKYVYDSDVVFHLAAQIHVDKSITNPIETIDVNVNGTLNILESCKRYDKRLIFASTSEVYGTNQHLFYPMAEDHSLDCQSPYGASKVAADRLCKSYYDTYGTKVTILRNFNTFGEWQNDGSAGCSYGSVIGIFTRQALANKPLYIYGDGEQERDYMYIDQCIEGYKLCLENKDLIGQVINVGSGKTITINKLAKLIVKATGSHSEIIHTDERPGEVRCLCADMGKAKKFGLDIKHDFEKSLFKYIKWYKKCPWK